MAAQYQGPLDSTDDGLNDDDKNVFLQDDPHSSSRSSRKNIKKKYVVSESRNFKYIPARCKTQLTRNERICIVVGTLAVVAIVVVFVTIAVTASPSFTKSNDMGHGNNANVTAEKWSNVRLQSSVFPNSYDISISVDLDTFQVMGSVRIACSVRATVDYIALHVKDMNISSDGHRLTRNDKDVEHNEVIYTPNDFFIFNLTQTLPPGLVIISMNFSYVLRKDLAGFYRSSYVDAQGATRYLASTHFEATNARRAFPCFDEPALKANFTMQINHHSRYKAWSNMPRESSSAEDSDGFVTTQFETSVRMSSYLVAFVVADFACIDDTINSMSGNHVMVQVCSNPVTINLTQYALDVAKNVILFYEQEFGVPYPLPKQDLFAIPDFSAGAMENWGLITYRETALLYNGDTDPAISKQRVAVVIAHELAHQWFGNLVTMAWWDGLWLNEGFASFMEYSGTNSYEPSFYMMEQFIVSDLVPALALDGLNESHPILQDVKNPNEISSLFDSISYSKGASIIRMLKNYIGHEAFRTGIQSYLTHHQYGNAETKELWESLQTATPEQDGNLTEIMDTWTKQMGFPIFTVNRTGGSLTQTRFFLVKPKNLDSIASSPYNYLWKVPFDYIHVPESGKEVSISNLILITAPSTSLQWPSDGFIKANVNQTGFFRVNYELSDWHDISAYLMTHIGSPDIALSAKDRAGLIDDAFALSRAGHLDIKLALNLSSYLVGEEEYVPWSVGLSWFYILDDLLSLSPKYGVYRDFVNRLLGELCRFSTEDSSGSGLTHLQIYLRSALLSAASHFGNKEVIENATDIFRQWKEEDKRVDPNLKSLVYAVGIAYGDEKDWEFVWDKYNHSQDPYEKKLFLIALSYSKELWILNRFLTYSVTKIRSQDTLSVIIYVSRNIHGRYLAWNFVRDNWQYLFKRYGEHAFFARFLLHITSRFATESELQQLKDLYARNRNTGTATRGFKQAIETVKGNIAWMKNF